MFSYRNRTHTDLPCKLNIDGLVVRNLAVRELLDKLVGEVFGVVEADASTRVHGGALECDKLPISDMLKLVDACIVEIITVKDSVNQFTFLSNGRNIGYFGKPRGLLYEICSASGILFA